MRKTINLVLMMASLALILGLVLAIGAETEESRSEKRRKETDTDLSREEISRLIEIIRIWKLVDELGLNEQQLTEFLPRFKELRDMRREHYRDRRRAIEELDGLVEAGNFSESSLKPKVDKFRSAEVNYYRKYKELHDALNAKLTVKQQAKYIVFEDKYRDDMGRLINTLRGLSEQREP